MIELEWWKDFIAADIYTTLKNKEHELPIFRCNSYCLAARTHIIDWMCLVSEQLDLSSLSLHLSVYILDYYMDGVDIDKYNIYLLAMTCVRIACKFEEHKLPCTFDLNSMLPKAMMSALGFEGYSPRSILTMELSVLHYHQWRISRPTVAHFLPYFMTIAVDCGDLHNGVLIKSPSAVLPYVEKHTKYFSDISLQDHAFRDFPPSLVASACVAASRLCLYLTPTWPKHMMLLTDYFLEELHPCLHLMLRYHQRDEVRPPLSVMPAVEYVMPDHYRSDVTPHHQWITYGQHSFAPYHQQLAPS